MDWTSASIRLSGTETTSMAFMKAGEDDEDGVNVIMRVSEVTFTENSWKVEVDFGWKLLRSVTFWVVTENMELGRLKFWYLKGKK